MIPIGTLKSIRSTINTSVRVKGPLVVNTGWIYSVIRYTDIPLTRSISIPSVVYLINSKKSSGMLRTFLLGSYVVVDSPYPHNEPSVWYTHENMYANIRCE